MGSPRDSGSTDGPGTTRDRRSYKLGKRINPVRSRVQEERKAVFKAIIESTQTPNLTATSLKVKEASSIQEQ
jgi:hypothetical protein